jgi:DNA-binding NarL/FixJ family response regulator
LPVIRILLIEDNRILREGIAAMLNDQADFEIAAVSDGMDGALPTTRSVKPHVVLMDLGLDSRNRLDMMRSLKKEFPEIKIVGMGLAPAQADILEFVEARAEGFILKSATVSEMIETIRVVASGGTVLPSSMTGALFSQVVAHSASKGKRNLKAAIRMTEREKEVIALIVDAKSNKEIAGEMNIATFTVKSHVHNIMEKLALHSRLQIANHAREQQVA